MRRIWPARSSSTPSATPRSGSSPTAIRADDDGDVVAEGELTVKGRTKAVEAHGRLVHIAEDISGGERIGLSLETTVDRREFGLEWNAPLPKGGFALGNDVKLVVALELVPKEA